METNLKQGCVSFDTEKVRSKKKSQGKALQTIDRVEPPRPPVYTESEAKEGRVETVEDLWPVPQPPGSSSPA